MSTIYFLFDYFCLSSLSTAKRYLEQKYLIIIIPILLHVAFSFLTDLILINLILIVFMFCSCTCITWPCNYIYFFARKAKPMFPEMKYWFANTRWISAFSFICLSHISPYWYYKRVAVEKKHSFGIVSDDYLNATDNYRDWTFQCHTRRWVNLL